VANVVVWGGDPLEIMTPVQHVFIRGREIPLVSRQTQLRDRYMDRVTIACAGACAEWQKPAAA
jgi:hypothetical protein